MTKPTMEEIFAAIKSMIEVSNINDTQTTKVETPQEPIADLSILDSDIAEELSKGLNNKNIVVNPQSVTSLLTPEGMLLFQVLRKLNTIESKLDTLQVKPETTEGVKKKTTTTRRRRSGKKKTTE